MVFVAIPRIRDGVPLTLGYVTKEVSVNGNPLITPYPSWSYNDVKYCDGVTSVYRMQVSFFFFLFKRLKLGKFAISKNYMIPL